MNDCIEFSSVLPLSAMKGDSEARYGVAQQDGRGSQGFHSILRLVQSHQGGILRLRASGVWSACFSFISSRQAKK